MTDLLYIASPSFSGSTLLTFLLNAHPDIATIGELKWGELDLQTYHCSCGALLRECHFWQAVESRMKERGMPFNLKRPDTDFRCRDRQFIDRIIRARVRGEIFEGLRDAAVAVLPACRASWPNIAAVNREIIRAILELQNGRIFLDGSKDPVRLKYLTATGDYRIRVIHLIRDGRAVVNSAIKNENADAEVAAREWLRTHHQIERMRARSAITVLTIRYEDLCRNVEGVLADIWNFLNVKPSQLQDYRSVEHHILGNRMRLQASNEITLDEKWRQTLQQSDLDCFDRIAGGKNREYGYV